jgi:hypothetical protein
MNAAAIGLIGVIVGGLLAGAVNLVLDHRRRLAKANVAGRLIGVELAMARQKIISAIEPGKNRSSSTNRSSAPSSAGLPPVIQPDAPAPNGPQPTAEASEPLPAVDTDGWWMGDLPMDAWKKHQSHVATDVRPDTLEIVARAYALCALLNDEHARARTSDAGPSGDLHSYAEALESARSTLAGEPKIRTRKTRQQIARWSPALAATVAVLVLAVLALSAPRADVDSASVTAAVQSQLGPSMLVQCNPSARDWQCTAYPLSWPVSCARVSTALTGQPGIVDYAYTTPSLASSTCSGARRPVAFTTDVVGREVTAAVAEASGQVDGIRKLTARAPTSNGWQNLWRKLFG